MSRFCTSFLLSILAAMLILTCGCTEKSSEPTSNCSLSPSSVNFGTLMAGAYADSTISIENVGRSNLRIEAVSSDSDFTIVNYSIWLGASRHHDIGDTTEWLEPGYTLKIAIRFQPDTAGNSSAKAHLSGCDCGPVNCVGSSGDFQNALDAWLLSDERIHVADAIVWGKPGEDYVRLPYRNWTAEMKADLLSAYNKIVAGESLGIVDPPPLGREYSPDESSVTYLDEATAWQIYVAFVAHSLVVEREGWVPWSLADIDEEALRLMFSSDRMYLWVVWEDLYRCERSVTPGDPVTAYEFLSDNGMIAGTTRGTIERLLEWCRHNMTHFGGGSSASNMYAHWQYYGTPPLVRVIEGTISTYMEDNPWFSHWTKGCHGTTAFLWTVLQTVNIAVENVRVCEPGGCHSLTHFVQDDLFLTHGDDPYNRLWWCTDPPIDIVELLIDRTTFEGWFGDHLPAEERFSNVGRQCRELGLEYLCPYVLRERCFDIAGNTENADSRVFSLFGRDRTLEDLEALNLWERIDEKIELFGGCDSIFGSPLCDGYDDYNMLLKRCVQSETD